MDKFEHSFEFRVSGSDSNSSQPETRNPKPETVILVGFMGCGKSSVARALAARLHGEAVDLDQRIEARVGTTIAQLFATRGEEEFRRIETEALEEILDGTRGHASTPTLVATGGGIVTREENRNLLKAAAARGVLVVYLRAAPDVLAERIRRQPGLRPLIDGERVLDLQETRARVEELLAMRAPWYEEVANYVVDSGASSADAIVTRIADHIAKTNL
jgi:shikimate kinase